jgi:hypothetical protein
LERAFGKLRSLEEQRPEGQGDETPAAVIEAIERAHLAEVFGLQREIRRLDDLVGMPKSQCGQGQANQIIHLLTDQRVERLEGIHRRRAEKPTPMETVGKVVETTRSAWTERR